MSRTGSAVLFVFVALSSSIGAANVAQTPTPIYPAEGQGTGSPLFTWRTVGPGIIYHLCIWRVKDSGINCSGPNAIQISVTGIVGSTQSLVPTDRNDLPEFWPASWHGEKVRWIIKACNNRLLCSNWSTRSEFYPLAAPGGLKVTINTDDLRRPFYSWNNTKGEDAYLLSFCCTPGKHPRTFLVPAGSGGRPFRSPYELYEDLVDPPPRLLDTVRPGICGFNARSFTWQVAACRDGGCGLASARQTGCMGNNGYGVPPPEIFPEVRP